MTSSERFWMASMRYGDELFARGQYCDALAQYENAQALAALDEAAAENYDDALIGCYPATPTIDPTTLTPGTPVGTAAVPTEPTAYP
jgi:hypothetical protein